MFPANRLMILAMMLPIAVGLSSCSGDSPMNSLTLDHLTEDGPQSVFSADLDGDGDNDLATANEYTGTASVLINNGDGTFQGAVRYYVGICSECVFSADLDGDGDNDLAVANGGSDDVSILVNKGDGTFQEAVNYCTNDSPLSVLSSD